MKKTFKHLLMSVVFLLGILITLDRTGLTVEASSGAVVRKVTSVNELTGSKTIKLAKGKKAYLKTTVTVRPNRPNNKKVTYKSSNRKVATVTSQGVITGRKPGTVRITVTSKKDKKKKATVKVTVVKGRVTDLKFPGGAWPSEQLKKGDTLKLKPVITTSAGGSKAVVWETTNKKVAIVDKKGMVTAVGNGSACIIVTAADGTGETARFYLTVKNYKLKYKYEVMFFNPPYSDMKNMMYIKTNNPSDDFNVRLYNMDGKRELNIVMGDSYSYADLKDMSEKSVDSYYKVKDGYLQEIIPENPGKFKVRIEEIAEGKNNFWYLTGYDDVGYIDVKNYAKEKKEWMQSVINQVTTSSMTKKEKMRAIEAYMCAHSVYFKTPSDNVGHSLHLVADVGVPFWKFSKYEFDSYTSPAMLVEFGDMINYPLENLFWKYERGTPEWISWHYMAKSVEDGIYYYFCPPSGTNIIDVSKIKQIDLSTWNFYRCYK